MKEKETKKFKQYYFMMTKWLKICSQGHSLAEYFTDRDIKHIGIYGMQEIGELFYEEINRTKDIRIEFVMDANPNGVFYDAEVIPMGCHPECDIIVVTPFAYFENIKSSLAEFGLTYCVSIEDVVYDIYDKYISKR